MVRTAFTLKSSNLGYNRRLPRFNSSVIIVNSPRKKVPSSDKSRTEYFFRAVVFWKTALTAPINRNSRAESFFLTFLPFNTVAEVRFKRSNGDYDGKIAP